MVADNYFELRSRLGAALFSLGPVADHAGVQPSLAPQVKALVESLRDPFVFVVAGEVNAGKSTLLNALFGEEFCPAGVLPETRGIHYFSYAPEPRRERVNEELEEIGLPHAFLRDFHVVDTPGVNSVRAGHDEITGNFIPRADAVLFCFPATNPWSGAAWEFLERIHRNWLRKVVLVLQQSDLRTPGEAESIAEHMRAIARQRLGAELPVFPVSARLALMARTSGVDKAGLLAASAFPALEAALTAMVTGMGSRRGKLVSACAAGQALLAEIQANLEDQRGSLTDLREVRDQAEGAVEAARPRVLDGVREDFVRFREAWASCAAAALPASLARRRTFPSALWARDDSGETVENALLPPILTAAREAAMAADGRVGGALHALWKQPGSSIHRALEGRARRPEEPAWPDRLTLFRASLESAVCDCITQSGVAAWWQDRLRQRRQFLRGFAGIGTLILGAFITAAAGQALTLTGLIWGCLLLAGVVVTGWLNLVREKEETAAGAALKWEEAGMRLNKWSVALAGEFAGRRMDDFDPQLQPLREKIADKEDTLEPLELEFRQLAGTLREIARGLRPAVS